MANNDSSLYNLRYNLVNATLEAAEAGIWNAIGASSGVASIQADAGPALTGAVQLVSGTNITLSQVGQAITINSAGGGGTPGGDNTQIQYNNSGAFGGDAGLTWDGENFRVGTAGAFLSTDGSAGFANNTLQIDNTGNLLILNHSLIMRGGGLGVETYFYTAGTSGASYVCNPEIPSDAYFGAFTFMNMATDQLAVGDSLAVGTIGDSASAILAAQSGNKGFLPPRMDTTSKNAIGTPAAGLIVYDTTLNKLCVFTGAAWETITSV